MNKIISNNGLRPIGPYLAHHGIKGQEWYHRRYQNYDGSYTEAADFATESVKAAH